MGDIIIEIPLISDNDFYFLCHYCNLLKKKEEIITCSIDDCEQNFCLNCIVSYFSNSFNKIKKESEENGWICYKCQKICNCQKCNKKQENNIINENNEINEVKNKIELNRKKIKKKKKKKEKKIKSNEQQNKEKIFYTFKVKKPKKPLFFSQKYSLKEIRKSQRKYFLIPQPSQEKITKESGNDAYLIDSIYNGYKPIFDISETKFPYMPSQKPIISKFESQLIKIARICEHFYRHKCKNDYFKKTCIICKKKEHHTNELIRFKNSKDFINYLRYLFICMEDVLNYKIDIFKKNKDEFMDFFTYFEKGFTKWGFKNTKVICKLCMFEILNKSNSLNFFQNNLKDSSTEQLIDSDESIDEEIIKDKSNIKIKEDLIEDMKKLYKFFFENICELLSNIIFLNKLHYLKLDSINQTDILNIKEQVLIKYNLIENYYKQLSQFFINYSSLINDLIINVCSSKSITINNYQIVNTLLNIKIEAKNLNQNFLIAFEKFKRIYQKLLKSIDNEYKLFINSK